MNKSAHTEKTKVEKIISAFLLLLLFMALFVFNLCTPYYTDDYIYGLTTPSLSDVLPREYDHYMGWSGRSVAHIICRVFLLMPKTVFNVCNAAVFVVLTLLVCVHISGQRKLISLLVWIVSLSLLWLCLPQFGETCLWLTGSCNYLWGTVIVLSFAFVYRHESESSSLKKINPIVKAVAMFFFGVIAGWCNENTSGGAVLFVCGVILFCLLKKKHIKAWMLTGGGGVLTGFLFMILAPGNSVRAEIYYRQDPNLILSFSERLALCLDFIGTKLWFLYVIVVIAFIVLWIKNNKNNALYFIALYTICGSAMIAAMLFSPQVPERSFFGACAFLVIAAVLGLEELFHKEKIYRYAVVVLTSVLVVCASINLFYATKHIITIKQAFSLRREYIQTQVDYGCENIIVPSIEFSDTKYSDYGYGPDPLYPEHIMNQHAINFEYSDMGITTLQNVPKSSWDKIYNFADYTLTDCIDLSDYLDAIANREDLLVMIAAQGDYSQAVSENSSEKMTHIGLDSKYFGNSDGSYIAVLNGGKVLYNESQKTRLTYSVNIIDSEEIPSQINITSDTSSCSIVYNDYNYAFGAEGLNIVVYNTESGIVVDSVVFRPLQDMAGYLRIR